jgi:hypothetical protein
MKDKKPDCYKCKYRGEVPGSAHSRCNHPKNKETLSNPMLGLMAILGSANGNAIPNLSKLKVKGDPHGVRNGWFNFPFDFDPVWLEECEGFTKK